MNDDKVSKKFILKNLVVFGALLLIFFCVIHFNISIGFTVFEDIENIPLFIVISVIFLIVIILVITVVIVLVIVYIIKIKGE